MTRRRVDTMLPTDEVLVKRGGVQRSAKPTNLPSSVLLTGKTEAFTFTVPANCYIKDIYIKETSNHAITGGLKFGTAAAGTQVITALSVGANANKMVADASLTLKFFSNSDDTTIYVDAVSSWNSAEVDMQVFFGALDASLEE